jgi:GDP-L-fucose synthase
MKVLVTGSNGLAGNAIRRASDYSHYKFNFITRSSADLRCWNETDDLIRVMRPDAVIHCAARCGGITANSAMHADFLYDNLMINANVLKSCANNKVEKVLAFSSVCVFPDDLAILEEDRMHDGPVFEGNFAYGTAKRLVDTHIKALKIQYGVNNYCSVIPGNIFGPADQFSVEHGHVIPALIHKLYLAKQKGEPLKCLGDGNSLREFIYVDDLANCLLSLLDKPNIPERIIISGEKEHSIREIVEFLGEISGHRDIMWDGTLNGQRSRPTSKTLFRETFPEFKYTDIKEGLAKTWDWFVENYPNVRMKY